MNIIKTSTVALLLASTLAMAGGDIAPIEPEINTPEVIEAESALTGFYAGLGYSFMKMDDDQANTETTGHAISVQAGYNFNPYLAVEGRYTASSKYYESCTDDGLPVSCAECLDSYIEESNNYIEVSFLIIRLKIYPADRRNANAIYLQNPKRIIGFSV